MPTYNELLVKPQFVKRIVTEAEIRALFSSPIILVPAKTGVFLVPQFAIVRRETGTAYTLNGATLVRFTTSTAGGSVAPYFGMGTAMFSSGAERLEYMTVPNEDNTTSGIILSFLNNGSQYTGSPIRFTNNSADFTGGSGRICILLTYLEIPYANNYYF